MTIHDVVPGAGFVESVISPGRNVKQKIVIQAWKVNAFCQQEYLANNSLIGEIMAIFTSGF